MRIAVDMDEVLSDTHAAKVGLYSSRFGYAWSDDEMRGRHVADLAAPEHVAAIETELHVGTVFAGFAPIDGAVEALRNLSESHEIFIATAAMDYPASCLHKVAWLERYFPFVHRQRIVLCGDKSIINADVLIDDSPHHFETFDGHGILFSAHHNANSDWPERISHWSEAAAVIDRLDPARAA